ncbi:energy-coupling factor transporter transmembrane component T family protein [Actinokineospora globicatena]|uniref:energy-coupling factor transporter transmembrane component T family protein n=1 Tax=Actinokineospora globicatena TaxID=103729 RepID=UPI0020A4AEBE|nr:energy-coupling factor transporter transmembrane protein EcfT [Actinokineospora globicatena]MCP2305894.1 biotin transport system permease protein [Actinokineospora globicatena]GLW80237.1 cobalt ABC transporter permease [Actinokineospora globicatena]GLW87066.1 cobalt ABC transporter permease [Actinokineospora globicatena]
MLSLYHEARSPVHRSPAGAKLAVLLAVGTGLFFVRSIAALGAVLLVVALCYAVAKVPARVGLRQLRPVLPVLIAIVIAQLVLTGWVTAVLVGQRVLVLVALANLVTLTTRTSAMIDTVEAVLRPLRPLGVRPERVGLLVALTIRFVPVLKEQADQVRAAHRARGLRGTRFLTPLLIKTLRLADGLGSAIEARGGPD